LQSPQELPKAVDFAQNSFVSPPPISLLTVPRSHHFAPGFDCLEFSAPGKTPGGDYETLLEIEYCPGPIERVRNLLYWSEHENEILRIGDKQRSQDVVPRIHAVRNGRVLAHCGGGSSPYDFSG